jgi:methionyl-tRNA formyltransferase
MINVIFFGTPDFAVPALQSLIECPTAKIVAVVTQPDKPAGRGAKMTASPIKILAQKHELPVLQPKSVRRNEPLIKELLALGPIDLGIVVAFGQILPETVLSLPRSGCVNIHASLLPRWRGAAPIQRAILSGDSATGIALMKMEAGLDTGPIYAQAEIKIGLDNAGELHDRLAELGAKLLLNNLEQIYNGTLTPAPQLASGITYADKITPTDLIINWTHGALEIERQVRAFSPLPGAYTKINGKRLKILAARALEAQKQHRGAKPGTVTVVDRHTLEVSCGTGVLSLEEVQLEGRTRLPTSEFIKGNEIAVGTVLG